MKISGHFCQTRLRLFPANTWSVTEVCVCVCACACSFVPLKTAGFLTDLFRCEKDAAEPCDAEVQMC